jgi:hypothetical protein
MLKVPWHSHSWLCASNKRNGFNPVTMSGYTSPVLWRIATRRQPNHFIKIQLC